jgi:hypothetical protein
MGRSNASGYRIGLFLRRPLRAARDTMNQAKPSGMKKAASAQRA